MKHALFYGSCFISGVIAAVVFHAFGWIAWLCTLTALMCVMLMSWTEGQME